MSSTEPFDPTKHWRPRLALQYICALFACYIVAAGITVFAFTETHSFAGNSTGAALINISGFVFMLALAIPFAKVKSAGEFNLAFGLVRAREQHLLLAAAAGLILQICYIYAVNGGLHHLQFKRSFDLWTVAILLAPFFEEPVMRGFIYTAFRKPLSIAPSLIAVVLTSFLLHPSKISRSFQAIVAITLLNILACLFRERARSLWNCIACHLAFNTVAAITV